MNATVRNIGYLAASAALVGGGIAFAKYITRGEDAETTAGTWIARYDRDGSKTIDPRTEASRTILIDCWYGGGKVQEGSTHDASDLMRRLVGSDGVVDQSELAAHMLAYDKNDNGRISMQELSNGLHADGVRGDNNCPRPPIGER